LADVEKEPGLVVPYVPHKQYFNVPKPTFALEIDLEDQPVFFFGQMRALYGLIGALWGIYKAPGT
jgi:hypothetical protein